MGTIRSVMTPIHSEGYRFIAMFVAAAAFLLWLWTPLGVIAVIATLWCVYFFRDPARVTPAREGLVTSPADGVVQSIVAAAPPVELGMGAHSRTRIAVFMNVFDVHVNRVPGDGEITALSYRPGKFFNASLDKASEDNERQSVRMTLDGEHDIAFVQIAGLVARRIVCDLYEGQRVRAGERFGLIRFGSRVDVYLDDGLVPQVMVGQRAVAGETVLALAGGIRAERREDRN